MSTDDRLEKMFERQMKFMEMLRENDLITEFPLELTSKPSQRLIKETIYNLVEELMEASFCLRNKLHRVTDVRILDREHYVEELCDAFAYFMEVCILSGISPQEIYQEYCRKNEIVKERLVKGY